MAKKSTMIGLPIVPYNQNKHTDLVQYLEYIEDFLMKVYTPDDDPLCHLGPQLRKNLLGGKEY